MNKLYQKRIIAFMWEKDRKLKELGVKANYMCKEIEDDILKWKDEEAKRVYERMSSNITERMYVEGMGTESCSYCIYSGSCNKCFYGELNGRCDIGDNNIYETICDEIEALGNKSIIKYPDNKFYRWTIRKIEKEIK